MSDTSIKVRGLGKRYRIGEIEHYGMFRDAIMKMVTWPQRALQARRNGGAGLGHNWFWALKDVDLDVKQGEVVGIVGRNGAGKSTLLKVLSRITDPTEGEAEIHGRMGSLLEVGTGFHQELSGRENIFMNGALLGMRRAEIISKLDEIVAFSEVDKFIDTPVKRYSSGMYMRLAFAVAAHLEPEILIIDEVLSVGDAAFQKKCLGKMGEVAKHGRTVLFVSHNMAAVQSLCQKAVMLQTGRVIAAGKTEDVVRQYLDAGMRDSEMSIADRRDRRGDGTTRMTSLSIETLGEEGAIHTASRLKITIGYQSEVRTMHPRFVARISDPNNVGIYLLDSDAGGGLPTVLPARGTVTCVTSPLHITPGRCTLSLQLYKGYKALADEVEGAASFDVEAADVHGSGKLPTRDQALCVLPQAWSASDDAVASNSSSATWTAREEP